MSKAWFESKRLAVEKQVAYLFKLRLRALSVLVGLAFAVIGIVSVTAAPAWPVIVGAVAVAAVAVNRVASSLTRSVCIGCGHNIGSEPVGQYGVVCPKCGTISKPAGLAEHAQLADTTDDADSADLDPDSTPQS